MPAWIDTHVHLDAMPDGFDPAAEVEAARRAGVAGLVIPGVTPAAWPRLLEMARTLPGVFAAPGLHPLAAAAWSPQVVATLGQLLGEPRTAALGEVGLDALIAVPQALQESVLRAQLELAVASGTPVLLHCRRANGRLLELLDATGAARVGGIWHAFSGSYETAMAAIRRNFAIAFGGSLTWPGARRAPEVLLRLPDEWLVLETDAPDLAPAPHRGKVNRPCWLPLVGAVFAELRGLTLEQAAALTSANARRILQLPPEPAPALTEEY